MKALLLLWGQCWCKGEVGFTWKSVSMPGLKPLHVWWPLRLTTHLGTSQKTLFGGFSIFAGEICHPSIRIGKICTLSSYDWHNLGVPTFFFIPFVYVLWPYLSYFRFLIITFWRNLDTPLPISEDWQNITLSPPPTP